MLHGGDRERAQAAHETRVERLRAVALDSKLRCETMPKHVFLRVVLSKRELPAAEGIRARHCSVPGRERARLADHPGPPVRADGRPLHFHHALYREPVAQVATRSQRIEERLGSFGSKLPEVVDDYALEQMLNCIDADVHIRKPMPEVAAELAPPGSISLRYGFRIHAPERLRLPVPHGYHAAGKAQ